MSQDNQEIAKEFIEKFGFKKKLDEIIEQKDNNLILIFTANLAIFSVSSVIIFSANYESISPSILLILCTTIFSLVGALLNIWYLVRLKKRNDLLKNKQEEVFKKTELYFIKTFNFIKKINKAGILNNAKKDLEDGKNKDQIIDNIKKDDSLNFLSGESVFLFTTILELSLKETMLNINKYLDEPLKEKFPNFKLFVDRFSTKTRSLSLIVSSTTLLLAILIKFILG